MREAPNIIYAKEILIEERLNQVSKMIDKSLQDFNTQMKRYTTDLTKRMKRATANRDYGFVRKPELRHQYGMLFNHHGQVISGLKNIDLFHLRSQNVTTGPLHINQTAINMYIILIWDSEPTNTAP